MIAAAGWSILAHRGGMETDDLNKANLAWEFLCEQIIAKTMISMPFNNQHYHPNNQRKKEKKVKLHMILQ